MEFGISSNFEGDLNIPAEEDSISEADVFVYDKEDRENFFLKIYCNFVGDRVNSHAQRVTDAITDEYREFVEEFLDDPEVTEKDDVIFARSREKRLSFDPDDISGGVLTYHGDFSELEDIYIPDSEPLTRDEYREAVEIGLNELSRGLKQMIPDPKRLDP